MKFSPLLVCFLFWFNLAQGQTERNLKQLSASFIQTDGEQFGFDELQQLEWAHYYAKWTNQEGINVPVIYQSILANERVNCWFKWKSNHEFSISQLRFDYNNQQCDFRKINDSIVEIAVPPTTKNSTLYAFWNNEVIGVLQTIVLVPQTIELQLVPLVKGWTIQADSLQNQLNVIFRQAAIQFHVTVRNPFIMGSRSPKKKLDEPFSNHDRYTEEMRKIRDAFLNRFPNTDQRVYTFFVVPGFLNSTEIGASVHNKTMGFIQDVPQRLFALGLAKQLAVAMGGLKMSWVLNGPKKGTTQHLLDIGNGMMLRHDEWIALQHAAKNHSFTDGFEEIKTSIGLTAYYFWEEDALGNIVLKGENPLDAIKRPFKKNTFSYHLQIENWWYRTLFVIYARKFALIHLVCTILLLFFSWKMGKKIRRWIASKRKKSRFLRVITRLLLAVATLVFVFLSWNFIDLGYRWFEVKSGEIKELSNQSMVEVIEQLAAAVHPTKIEEETLCSEMIVRSNKHYYLKQRKRVVYFDVVVNEDHSLQKMRFSGHSDSINLTLKRQQLPANSHYCVLRYWNESGTCIAEKVFNHGGYELTDKLVGSDPPKRILVFVNGYRPTSLGGNFESHFEDLKANGLEFPNSFNHLYTEDKYDYWHPWNQIDTKFSDRIKPTEIYYADGHFSVSTSNHRSLIHFTSLSARYPKRCSKTKPHRCYFQETTQSKLVGGRKKPTKSLLPLRSNYKGFHERYINGKVAGRNLLQVLNELPNSSKNDTLYIVAHSMGFAYAQGMIAALRGKIEFGSYFIIAPENGKAGYVRKEEWHQVWQYGSDLQRDAPCLQDGIAPQLKINGLPANHRSYIPASHYQQKGFFNAHFVGYYTWIFNLLPHQVGYVQAN
jgi:hypothetical protein